MDGRTGGRTDRWIVFINKNYDIKRQWSSLIPPSASLKAAHVCLGTVFILLLSIMSLQKVNYSVL